MSIRHVRRVAERLNCDIAAHVVVDLLRRPARIVDLTPFGAQIQMATPFPEGIDINIEIKSQTVVAKIMWADGKRMGVRFSEPVADGPLRKHIESLNASIYGDAVLPSMRRLKAEV